MRKKVLERTLACWPWVLAALAAGACGGEKTTGAADVVAPEQPVGAHPGCAAILPNSLGPPVVDASLSAGHSSSCWGGITDGQGHVALGIYEGFDLSNHWTVKPPCGGAPVGSFGGFYIPELIPQRDGWIGGEQRRDTGYGEWWFLNGWAHDGRLLNKTRTSLGGHAVPDRTSGALVAFEGLDEVERPLGLKVQRFDSGAAPRSGAVLIAGAAHNLVAAGVDDRGDALALFDGSTAGLPPGHVAGRWLDPDGAARTDVFDTGLTPSQDGLGTLAPLYDGSLVLQRGGQWVARFTHLSTAPAGPAPQWLAARPSTRLVRIRDGKGYALLPGRESVAECKEEIFLYTRAGAFCGSLTFPVDDLPCTTRGLNVGPDGTVVQLSPRQDGPCLDPPTCWYRPCNYSWWPHLLGRQREPGEAPTCHPLAEPGDG